MASAERIYLDNAATSWPKPETVYRAVDEALRTLGAPAGRSAYWEANEVERRIGQARRRLAELIGAAEPRRVVFTCNGTDSLNLALHGLLRPGDHVVTSVVEHNSVLRPLRRLEDAGQIAVTRVDCDGYGQVDPDDVRRAIRPATRLIALLHASNVTGTLQPIEAIGQIARQSRVRLLVDAAQTIGHRPLDVGELGADLLAAPAHKGLLAPPGVGFLYIGPGIERELRPVRQGGTGTRSERDRQPETLPDCYESGSHNVAGLLGLEAGLSWLAERGLEQLERQETELVGRLLEGLRAISGVTIYGHPGADHRVGVVSLRMDGWEPQDLATLLDSTCGAQVRAGFQCAPLLHQALGTAVHGGTLRLSLGAFNTRDDIDTAVRALGEMAAGSLA